MIIAQGHYGVVYLVTDGNAKFAIKRVLDDKKNKNREQEILQVVKHPHIIQHIHTFYSPSANKNESFVNFVTDYLPETLGKLIKNYKKNQQHLPNLIIKICSYQMLRALLYLHSMNIMHRDLKPQNVLIDTENYLVKLCDFGSAKYYKNTEENTSYMCSRFYRAPELILGSTVYDFSIDMWSFGCILGEMVLQEPLFSAGNNVDLMIKIISILGSPTQEDMYDMNPDKAIYQFPKYRRQPLVQVFQGKKADPLIISLISKILVYSPFKRLTAKDALLHPYFQELRQQEFALANFSLPDFFNFSEEELLKEDEQAKNNLIPSWYIQKQNEAKPVQKDLQQLIDEANLKELNHQIEQSERSQSLNISNGLSSVDNDEESNKLDEWQG